VNHADINFYFDPLRPFAWMTSKWVRQVTAHRDYTVDWRFISLRISPGTSRQAAAVSCQSCPVNAAPVAGLTCRRRALELLVLWVLWQR
jgi:hypothetical protein